MRSGVIKSDLAIYNNNGFNQGIQDHFSNNNYAFQARQLPNDVEDVTEHGLESDTEECDSGSENDETLKIFFSYQMTICVIPVVVMSCRHAADNLDAGVNLST